MADGTDTNNDSVDLDLKGEDRSLIMRMGDWLFSTRPGLLSVWSFLAFSSLVGAMVWHVFGNPFLTTNIAKAIFIATSALLWLPLLLLLMDRGDNLSSGPKILLPAMCLTILIALTSFAVLDETLDWQMLGNPGAATLETTVYRCVFGIYFLLSFIPLFWNASNFTKHDLAVIDSSKSKSTANDNLQVSDDADAAAMGALIATTVVIFIVGLAFIAGEMHENLSFPNGFGLILCSAVIGVFAVVIFMETIADWPPIRLIARMFRGVAHVMRPLANFYEWIDAGLVRTGSTIAGMRHHRTISRYTLLAGTLLCLSMLGWWLPSPFGLAPVFAAFVIALSVSRLWSWVEDDRALAAMTEYRESAPYRIGFREDFRDETLLGFAFVFILVPIAMMQAHVGTIFGPDLFANANDKQFFDWIGYFGVELAKAVPIVDWAEIYNVTPNADLIQMNKTPSRHAVFLARVMVDLVLISALLQAIGISTRNRQQKRLYHARHVSRLDLFVERVEIGRAMRAARLSQTDAPPKGLEPSEAATYFDLARPQKLGLVDFRHYDEDRLRHLFWSEKSNLTRAFIQALAHERHMPLSTAIDLTKDIAHSHRNELDLFKAYQRALTEHDEGHSLMDVADIYTVLAALRNTSGLKDFKIRLIDKMAEIGPSDEASGYLSGLAAGDKADQFLYTRNHAAKIMTRLAAEISSADVIETIGKELMSAPHHERLPSKTIFRELVNTLRKRLRRVRMELDFPIDPTPA